MDVQARYHYFIEHLDQGIQELYIRDTGVHALTIWHDWYISQMQPRVIAQDRDLPVDTVYEALSYCQEPWEVFATPKHKSRHSCRRGSSLLSRYEALPRYGTRQVANREGPG